MKNILTILFYLISVTAFAQGNRDKYIQKPKPRSTKFKYVPPKNLYNTKVTSKPVHNFTLIEKELQKADVFFENEVYDEAYGIYIKYDSSILDGVQLNNLGYMYYHGYGASKNILQAKDLFEKASKKGNTDALTNLGELYILGKGITTDYKLAKKYLELSADKGNPKAMYDLGLLYEEGIKDFLPQNYKQAKYYYEKADMKGNLDGTYALGMLYLYGDGVLLDTSIALSYFKKAISKGDLDVMSNLGGFYQHGVGFKKNIEQAKLYYEMAANKGFKSAMHDLGLMYYDNNNYSLAKYWFEKAIEKKCEYYCKYLGDMYRYGYGVAESLTQAKYYYEIGCNLGNSGSCASYKEIKVK
jgi:TPR repeat protein